MNVRDDKPRPTREHCLEQLRQMVRIRQFEDKCAELYTQEKIRGFLHLYDGEEAIAAGVIPLLGADDRIVATYREHGHALVRGVPMAAHGRDVRQGGGLLGRPRRLHAPLRRGGELLRRQRHRRRRAAAGRRAGAGATAWGARRRHRLLLRRGRGRRGRVPRERQPRRAVAPAGALRLREQPLRHGHRSRPLGVGDRHPRQGGGLRHRLGGRRRHGCGRGRGGRTARAACHPRGRPAALPGVPHLPLPRPFDVRRPALPGQGRGRGLAGEGADRTLPGLAEEPTGPRRRTSAPSCRGRGGDRRAGRLRRSGRLGAGRGLDPPGLAGAPAPHEPAPPTAAPRPTARRSRPPSATPCTATRASS